MKWKENRDAVVLLAPKTVHLWRVAHCSDPLLETFRSVLSPSELARSEKSIVARGALRLILSRYLQQKPHEIQFETGEFGKLFLPGVNLQFNLSHSGDTVLIGIAHCEIGVDVEKVRNDLDFPALSERFFTEAENKAIHHRDDFYRAWTRKEAFIKAIGRGLGFGLSQVEVNVMDTTESTLISVHGDVGVKNEWTLQSVAVEDSKNDYFAAVSVRDVNIQFFFWDLC